VVPKLKLTYLLVDGPIAFYLTRLEQRLEAHGGRYFGANRLTVGDLKAFVWIRHLKSGVLDHIPADLPDRVAPKLVEHYERVKNDPRIQAYYGKWAILAHLAERQSSGQCPRLRSDWSEGSLAHLANYPRLRSDWSEVALC
jgi:hypothetical protein